MPKNIANYIGYSAESDYNNGVNGNKGVWSIFGQLYFKYRNEWTLRTPFDDGNIVSTSTYTSPATVPGPSRSPQPRNVEFIVVGAGGGDNEGTVGNSSGAGQGGFSLGRFEIPDSQDLVIAVGTRGDQGHPGPGDGGIAYPPNFGAGGHANPGPYNEQYGGGGGGALSGVFVVPGTTPVIPHLTQANALIIAGGGGGNRYVGGIGGNGGGSTADDAPSPGTGGGGGGGSQVAGGAGGVNQPGTVTTATSGSAFTGGNDGSDNHAYGGGGGGSGYYGGGGGGGSDSSSGTNSAGGGGGSGHLKTSSPYYVPSPINRTNVGMGDPTGGTGLTPADLPGAPVWTPGLGKDHPQISPYWADGNPTKYGAGHVPGIVIVNYYG